MTVTDLTIVRRSLVARLFSTVTTVVTVAVAVALMLVLLSMRDSGERAFTRGTGNAQLLISRDASPMTSVLNTIFYVNAPAAALRWSEYEDLTRDYPFAFAAPTALGDSFRGMPVVATTTEFFTAFEPVAGEPFALAKGRVFERSFEVVVGADAAKRGDLRVGDKLAFAHGASDLYDPTIHIRAHEDDDAHDDHAHEDHDHEVGAHVHAEYLFEVVGVLERTASPHDRALFTDLTSVWILHAHDRREAQIAGEIGRTTEADLLPEDRKITGVYASVLSRPGAGVSAALQQIFEALRADPRYTVASPADQVIALFQIVSNVNQLLVGVAAVVMVSSAIAIMLALYNSMEQRRRQIAVMRVLGASRGRIFNLVLTESAVIGLLGAVAGLALAHVGARAAAIALEARLGLVVEPSIAPAWPILIVAATVGLSILAGVVPAAMAYRTSVARSLRPTA